MPCIDRRVLYGAVFLLSGWLPGCAQRAPGPTTPVTQPLPTPTPTTSPAAAPVAGPAPSLPSPQPSPGAPRAALPRLDPPRAARSWEEFKLQAANRLMAAHPDLTYTGSVPEPLLAIPVLEVELNADGSVRRVQVLRHPSQARDTTQIAIDAVHRAAPYGSMSRLPLPWKWVEVFLFDDMRRFKPRELDK